MNRKTFIVWLMGMSLGVSGLLKASEPATDVSQRFVESTDYSLLAEPQSDLPELILVFWYQSESSAEVYQALVEQGLNVTLWPAIYREAWRPAAKLALMAEQLEFTPSQQQQLFQRLMAMSKDNQSLAVQDQKAFVRLLSQVSSGTDDTATEAELTSANESDSTIELDNDAIETAVYDSELPKRLKTLQNRLKQLPISSVPTIIFKGRYIIDANQAKTSQRLLQIIQFLDQTTP